MERLEKKLSSDRPLNAPEFDKLGYCFTSRKIAKRILNRIPKKGFVISIEGKWGSGKSTFIEFIKYYLKQTSKHPEQSIVLG